MMKFAGALCVIVCAALLVAVLMRDVAGERSLDAPVPWTAMVEVQSAELVPAPDDAAALEVRQGEGRAQGMRTLSRAAQAVSADPDAPSSPMIAQRVRDLARGLQRGDALLDDVLALVRLLAEKVELDRPGVTEDGWTLYPLALTEDVGEGELRTRTNPTDGRQEFEFLMRTSSTSSDHLREEDIRGGRLELRVSLGEDDLLTRCSAFTHEQVTPSRELYGARLGDEWIPVGGALSATGEACEWTGVRLRFSEEDGQLMMKQEVLDAVPVPQDLGHFSYSGTLAGSLDALVGDG